MYLQITSCFQEDVKEIQNLYYWTNLINQNILKSTTITRYNKICEISPSLKTKTTPCSIISIVNFEPAFVYWA